MLKRHTIKCVTKILLKENIEVCFDFSLSLEDIWKKMNDQNDFILINNCVIAKSEIIAIKNIEVEEETRLEDRYEELRNIIIGLNHIIDDIDDDYFKVTFIDLRETARQELKKK